MGQLDFISKWKSRSDVCCKRSRLKIIFFRKSKCSQDGIQTATPWCGPHDLPEGWQPPLLRCHRSECGTRHFNLFVGDLLTIHSPGFGASFREVWRCWRHLLANWKGDWQVWTKVLNRFELYFSYFQVSRLCLCSVLRQARCRGESWPYGLPGLWLLLLKSQIISKLKNLITYTFCIWRLWANV